MWRDGYNLMQGDSVWRAIGVNFWDLDIGRITDLSDPFGPNPNTFLCTYYHIDLDDYFDKAMDHIANVMKANTIRTFGFISPFVGAGFDWGSTDKMLYYAEKYNLRVISVLGAPGARCGEAGRPAEWYGCTSRSGPDCTPGFMDPAKDPFGVSYHDYVLKVVERYRDRPVIAFWQLFNEPGTQTGEGEGVTWLEPSFAERFIPEIKAADPNHLVNIGSHGLGAGPVELAKSLQWQDLNEVHDYSYKAPMEGLPLTVGVNARLVLTPDDPAKPEAAGKWVGLTHNAWKQATVPLPGYLEKIVHQWRIEVVATQGWAGQPFEVYLDDGTVPSAGGSHAYTFETGTEGFESTDAALDAPLDMKSAHPPSAHSLHVGLSTASAVVRAPVLAPNDYILKGQSVQIWIGAAFTAPRNDMVGPIPGSVAWRMHLTEITLRHPFIVGEVGIPVTQASPSHGVAPCPVPVAATKADRAVKYDQMLEAQTDRFGGGFLVWSWKNPLDPREIVGCYAVTPDDPAEQVIGKWAQKWPNPPLAVSPYPEQTYAMVTEKPPATVAVGSGFGLETRVTKGGNAQKDFEVRAEGEWCNVRATTDELGVAAIACGPNAEGPATVRIFSEFPDGTSSSYSFIVTGTPGKPPPPPAYCAQYFGGPFEILKGGTRTDVPLSVLNCGSIVWRNSATDPDYLSYRWYNAANAGQSIDADGLRTPFDSRVYPGQTRSVEASVRAPNCDTNGVKLPCPAGEYTIRWDMFDYKGPAKSISFNSKGVPTGAYTVTVKDPGT